MRVVSLIFLGVSLMLSGCAAHHAKEEVVTTDLREEIGSEIFRSVRIQLDTFEGSGPRYIYRDYLPQIRQKIASSGLFKKEMGSYEDRVTLNVYWTWKNNHNDWIDVARAATLFIVPNKHNLDHKMRFELVHRGKTFKVYEYKENVQYVTSALTDNAFVGAEWFHKGVNPILRKFFMDLKKDGVLSVEQKQFQEPAEQSI